MWSSYTASNSYKLESFQRRAARWATRDYRYTSSVSAMLQDLNWRTLDQRRIDSRLVLQYKITCNLVVIPAADYLDRNTRPSTRTHSLAYRQISTLKDYYKFTFFPRTIIHWNALPAHIPVLPTLGQYSTNCLPGSPFNTLDTRNCFVYLLTILTLLIALYKLISATFLSPVLFS